MTNIELADKAKEIASMKTLFVEGCFGSPLTAVNRARFIRNHMFNARPERSSLIQSASSDTFGFCSGGLIKAICWGWKGMIAHTYGGAGYALNGVPDVSEDLLFSRCSKKSDDMDTVEIGDVVWTPSRLGIYIGDGQVVTSDYMGEDGVQISGMEGLENRIGWAMHGRLPGIKYVANGNGE